MKKTVLSFVFIGLVSWFGLFGEEPSTDENTVAGIVKRPIKW